MVEVGEQGRRKGIMIGHLWFMPLTQRLAVLVGLVLIGEGYHLILSSSSLPDMADIQTVTRYAVGGMLLVFFGGVVEVLVLLGQSRR